MKLTLWPINETAMLEALGMANFQDQRTRAERDTETLAPRTPWEISRGAICGMALKVSFKTLSFIVLTLLL